MTTLTEEQKRAFQQAMEEGHEALWAMDWERAAEAYGRAVEIHPNDYLALISWGLALFTLGRYEEAARAYRQATRVAPQEPVPWERLANIYEALEDYKAAAEAAMRAAELYAKSGQLDKAIFNWERVVRWLPGHLQAHHLLARAYEHLRRPHEAIAEYLYTAALLQRLNRQQEALRLLQRAERLAPQHPEVRRALRALHQGRPIPIPRQARRAPVKPQERPPAPATEEEDERQPKSLVDEAAERALAALAELAFMQAEESSSSTASSPRRRLNRLTESLRGSLLELTQRDTLLLLLSQVVEAQTRQDWETAATELERVVHAGVEHPAVFYDLGWLFAKLDRPKRALKYLQRAINHPDFALAAHVLMAELLYKLGRLEEAVLECLDALRTLDLQHVDQEDQMATIEAYYESAREALLQQDAKTWKRFYENVRTLLASPDWRAKVQALREQASSGRGDGYTDIVPLVDMLMEADTPRALEELRYVRELMRQGALDAAMEAAHFALFRTPTFLPLHMLIGDILWEQGLLEQATEKFFTLARVYVTRGEPRQAVHMLRRILQIHPMHTRAHQMLIRLLSDQGLYDQVIDAYLKLAMVHRQLANLDAADQTLNEALNLAKRMGIPVEKRIALLQAQVQLAVERLDWDKASQIYRELVKLKPDDVEIIASWMDLLFRQGKAEQALDVLEQRLRAWTTSTQGLQRAQALLERLLEQHPERPELLYHMGLVLAALGKEEEAVKTLDQAGEYYLQQNNLLGARRAIQAILKLNPPNAPQYRELLRQLEATRRVADSTGPLPGVSSHGGRKGTEAPEAPSE